MPMEIDPHKAYLDAVFARIERLRHVDVSVLADRYGFDSKALSLIEGGTPSSSVLERVVADADAQRDELREHLDALVSEYVSGGMEYGVALVMAQQTLGDPRGLGRQIARATSWTMLGLDVRWLAFLRCQDWLPAGMCAAMLFAATEWSLPRIALLVATVSLMASYAFMSGYAAGWTISPDSRSLACTLIPIIEVLEGDNIRSIGKTVAGLKRFQRVVLDVERSWPFWWAADCFTMLVWISLLTQAMHDSSFYFVTCGLALAFTGASFAQSVGVRLGRWRRLAHSMRRAS